MNSSTIGLRYILDQSYVDLCHPNNPNCVTGTTCPDCNDNFNPHLVTSSYLVTYANTPTSGNILNINEVPTVNANVFPNPSTGKFYLEFGSAVKSGNVVIYDVVGRTIYSQAVERGTQKLDFDLSGTAKGVYIIEFSEAGQKTLSKRIVLE